MRSIVVKWGYLIAAMLFLSSCATTSLVDSWHSTGLPGTKLHKLLVVGIFKNTGNRRVYEDILAGELNKRGVEAISSYHLFPGEAKASRQELAAAVKKSGAEAVLTLQTIKVKQETVVQPGYGATYPGYWYPSAFPSWDLYGYYGAAGYYEPPYVSTYEIAKIQANLFDARSGKLLWAGTIQTSEPDNVVSVAKELAGIVVKSLAKEGLI